MYTDSITTLFWSFRFSNNQSVHLRLIDHDFTLSSTKEFMSYNPFIFLSISISLLIRLVGMF